MLLALESVLEPLLRTDDGALSYALAALVAQSQLAEAGVPRAWVSRPANDALKAQEAVGYLVLGGIFYLSEDGLTVSMHALMQRAFAEAYRGPLSSSSFGWVKFARAVLLSADLDNSDYITARSESRALAQQFIEIRWKSLSQELVRDPAILELVRETLYYLNGHDSAVLGLGLEDYGPLFEEYLGDSDPTTIGFWNNIATSYGQTGQRKRAAEIYQKVLAARERYLGANDQYTITARNNLGQAYVELGDHDKGIPLLERAARERDEVLGRGDVFTLQSSINLAAALAHEGSYERALSIAFDAVSAFEECNGSDNASVWTARRLIGEIHLSAGDFASGLALLEQSVEGLSQMIDPSHPDALLAKLGLASAYSSLARHEESAEILKQLIEADPGACGDLLYCQSRDLLAHELSAMGHHFGSGQLFAEISRCWRQQGDDQSGNALRCQHFAAVELLLAGEWSTGIELLRTSVRDIQQAYGSNHALTKGAHEDEQFWTLVLGGVQEASIAAP